MHFVLCSELACKMPSLRRFMNTANYSERKCLRESKTATPADAVRRSARLAEMPVLELREPLWMPRPERFRPGTRRGMDGDEEAAINRW